MNKLEQIVTDIKALEQELLFELQKKQDGPFFLACGLFRPHLPWYSPKEHFDAYPLDQVILPPRDVNDLDDVPAAGKKITDSREFNLIQSKGKYREAVQAYLAAKPKGKFGAHKYQVNEDELEERKYFARYQQAYNVPNEV